MYPENKIMEADDTTVITKWLEVEVQVAETDMRTSLSFIKQLILVQMICSVWSKLIHPITILLFIVHIHKCIRIAVILK